MADERVIQGRVVGRDDVELIRLLIGSHPEWNRTRLSRELCQVWEWKDARGRQKDMACRSLLLKLEELAEICLPARRAPSVNHLRHKRRKRVLYDQFVIEGPLEELMPIALIPIESEKEKALWETLVADHHYLGYSGSVGENIKYMARDRAGRPLACLLFGSAAWKAASRDQFIGWTDAERRQRLWLITNNMRFLILPWVNVKNLASYVLSQVTRRVRRDWIRRYGHPVYLLETFVERSRFDGTCYKAANWRRVGSTQGRSRNDRFHRLMVPVKDVYVYPLVQGFRRHLSGVLSNDSAS